MNEHNYVTIIAFILQDAGENISEETVDDQVSIYYMTTNHIT